QNPEFDKEFHDVRKDVASYAGALLSYSWDLNIYATVRQKGTSIEAKSLEGACAPSDIMIADMLGFDFREEGENQIVKSYTSFIVETFKVDERSEKANVSSARDALQTLVSNPRVLGMSLTQLFLHRKLLCVFDAYSYFAKKGKAASLEKLVQDTK